jgi:hypothetical protein
VNPEIQEGRMPWSVERNEGVVRVVIEPPVGDAAPALLDRVIGEINAGGVHAVELPTSLEQGHVEDHAILDALWGTLGRMKVVILRPSSNDLTIAGDS